MHKLRRKPLVDSLSVTNKKGAKTTLIGRLKPTPNQITEFGSVCPVTRVENEGSEGQLLKNF